MKKILFFTFFVINIAVYAQPGSLDNTFGIGGRVTTDLGNDDRSTAVAIQSDGKIVVIGNSYGWTGNYNFSLVRYNYNGTLDSTFGSGGIVYTFVGGGDGAASIAIQNDDKIVVAGRNHIGDFVLVRYKNDGNLDSTFNADGMATTDFASANDYCYSVTIQSDGKIVAAGFSDTDSSYINFALVRYNIDGSLDSTFDSDGKVTTDFGHASVAYSVITQSDGKIVVAGFSPVGTNPDFALARYNNDGSLDNTFGSSGKVTTDFGGFTDECKSIVIQSDGKIVVAGFSYIASNSDFAIVRYNTDGTLDNTFGSVGKLILDLGDPDEQASSVALQNDGKIVVAGDGAGNGSLVRYNTNGSLYSTFGINGIVLTHFGLYGIGTAIAIQNDGKIVFAGYSEVLGSVDFAVERYNSNAFVYVEENIELNKINIFPNPSSGIYTVSLVNTTVATQICVYDLLGNCLWNKNCRKESSQKIDLSSQPKGIYFLETVSDDKRSANKIVLQ